MVSSGAALHHGSASEFTGPEYECGVEESALVEVLQECGDGLIGLSGVADVVVGVVVVPIPAQFVDGVADLYEADTFFDQAS